MDKLSPKTDVYQANRDRAAPLLAKLKQDGIGHLIDGQIVPSSSGDTFETGESLRNWLNGRLSANERVLAVEVRTSLPRVAVGKLDRKALRLEEAERTRKFSSLG